jgi:hypothetical protein
MSPITACYLQKLILGADSEGLVSAIDLGRDNVAHYMQKPGTEDKEMIRQWKRCRLCPLAKLSQKHPLAGEL